jgi:chromosome segregation ATPase
LVKSEEALNKHSQFIQSSVEEVTEKNSIINDLNSKLGQFGVEKEALERKLNFYSKQSQELNNELTKLQLLNPAQNANSKLVTEELKNQTATQNQTISDLLKQLNDKTTEISKLSEQLFQNSAKMQSDETLYTTNLELITSKLKHSEFVIESHQIDKRELLRMVADLEGEISNFAEERSVFEEEVNMLKAQNSILSKQMTEFLNNSSKTPNLYDSGYTPETVGDNDNDQHSEAYIQLAKAYNDLRLENDHLADINREVIRELNIKSKCFSGQSDEISKLGQSFSQNANLLTDIILERDELKVKVEALGSENADLKQKDSTHRYLNHQLCSQIHRLLRQIKLEDEKYPSPVYSSEDYEEIHQKVEYEDIESLQYRNFQLNEMVKKLHDHIKSLEDKLENPNDRSNLGATQTISSDISLTENFADFKSTIIQKYNQENLCLANILKEFSILFSMILHNTEDQSNDFNSVLTNIKDQTSKYSNLKEQFELFLNQIYTGHLSIQDEHYRLLEELSKNKMLLTKSNIHAEYLESQLEPLQGDLKKLTDLSIGQRYDIEQLNRKLIVTHNELDSLTQIPSHQIQQQCEELQNELDMARDFNVNMNNQFEKLQSEYNLTIAKNKKLENQSRILELVNESINSQLNNSTSEKRIQSLIEDMQALQNKVAQLESDKELLRLHLTSEQLNASQLSRKFHGSINQHFQNMQELLERIKAYKIEVGDLNNAINQLTIRNEELEAEAPLPTFDQTKFQELKDRCDQLEASNYALECQLISSSEAQMGMQIAIENNSTEKAQLVAKFEESSKALREQIECINQENATSDTAANEARELIDRLQRENKNILNEKEDLREEKEDEFRRFKLQLTKVSLMQISSLKFTNVYYRLRRIVTSMNPNTLSIKGSLIHFYHLIIQLYIKMFYYRIL